MSTNEYHTITPEGNPPTRTDVYHNKEKCPDGKRITAKNRRVGRGNATRLCEECPKVAQ